MLNHSQEQAFGPVPQILNVLVEQARKPVADIGARWEFVVKEAIELATIAILAGVVKILPHPNPPRTRGSGVRNSQMI
jgi:hypothetical protein